MIWREVRAAWWYLVNWLPSLLMYNEVKWIPLYTCLDGCSPQIHSDSKVKQPANTMLTPRDTAMEKKQWEGGKRGFIPWKFPCCLVLNCIQITLWMFPCSKPLLQIWDGRIIIAAQFIVKSWLYLLKKKKIELKQFVLAVKHYTLVVGVMFARRVG